MRKSLILIISFILILSVIVYNNYFLESEVTVYAMDTVMKIKIRGNQDVLNDVEKLLYDIDFKFNAYNSKSYIYKLNEGAIKEVPDDVARLIEFSLKICYETDGNFNIALKELKDLWNLSGENPRIPTDEEIGNALKSSDFSKIIVKNNIVELNGAKIDLGGVVKGYAADCVVGLLKTKGIKEAIIDLGGNVYSYSDNNDITVGIQKPFSQRGDVVCTTAVNDKAVVSSGTYERYFEQDGKIFHHIFDPCSGYPSDNYIESVTVIGRSSAECDIYSTALLVMGKEKAKEFYINHPEYEFLIISKGVLYKTPGLNINLIDSDFEVNDILK